MKNRMHRSIKQRQNYKFIENLQDGGSEKDKLRGIFETTEFVTSLMVTISTTAKWIDNVGTTSKVDVKQKGRKY